MSIPSTANRSAGTLLPVVYDADSLAAGAAARVSLRWHATLSWERVRDSRARFAPLQSALWGPTVLAALTYGDRTIDAAATLLPVPPIARRQLVTLRVVQEVRPEARQEARPEAGGGSVSTSSTS